jgi:hypothetical protein
MGANQMPRTIIPGFVRWVYRVYVWLSEWVSLPLSTLTILDSPGIHRSYKISVFRMGIAASQHFDYSGLSRNTQVVQDIGVQKAQAGFQDVH